MVYVGVDHHRKSSHVAVFADDGRQLASQGLESISRWTRADSTTTTNLRYRIDSAIRRALMRLTSPAGRLKATR
jgi:hypothetical protein